MKTALYSVLSLALLLSASSSHAASPDLSQFEGHWTLDTQRSDSSCLSYRNISGEADMVPEAKMKITGDVLSDFIDISNGSNSQSVDLTNADLTLLNQPPVKSCPGEDKNGEGHCRTTSQTWDGKTLSTHFTDHNCYFFLCSTKHEDASWSLDGQGDLTYSGSWFGNKTANGCVFTLTSRSI